MLICKQISTLIHGIIMVLVLGEKVNVPITIQHLSNIAGYHSIVTQHLSNIISVHSAFSLTGHRGFFPSAHTGFHVLYIYIYIYIYIYKVVCVLLLLYTFFLNFQFYFPLLNTSISLVTWSNMSWQLITCLNILPLIKVERRIKEKFSFPLFFLCCVRCFGIQYI